ncbi:hypothetical protein M0802_012818 [Mischocyttarus mexicanus]|nr:hypothetical protein M0802_012819 [Mischocyttarus mexicanus]KAI4485060.1 hypothetical protein M0802_012818 [Mischocyttarus mexicanus]
MKSIKFVMGLNIFVMFILLISKKVRPYEILSTDDEYISFIIDFCEFYGTKSTIFLYSESFKEMEMTTMIFKWTRTLSHEGFTTMNLYFSELHKSSYYVKRIVRPFYIVLISNDKAVNEFSLATSAFDMSNPLWLVIFIYNSPGSDYCHNPPGNLFHLQFNTQMLVRCSKENILREWYSIGHNRTEINDLALWKLEKGIATIASSTIYDRRDNLHGLVMRAVIVKKSPLFYLKQDGKFDGVFGRVLSELCATLNFSIDVVSKVDEYGRLDPKENSWSGAIGEIYSRRADISPSGFFMSGVKLNVVDFTLPIIISTDILYLKDPHMLGIKWSSYFFVFSYSISFAVLGILIIASIVLIIFKIRNGTDRNIGHLLSDNFLEIWSIFCQQGVTDFLDKSSLRIMYFSLCLFSVVLSAAYAAALISSLTSVIHLLPFYSLESFVEDGTYQLAVFRDSAEHEILINSNKPLSRKLMKLMVDEDQLPVTLLEGVEKVR